MLESNRAGSVMPASLNMELVMKLEHVQHPHCEHPHSECAVDLVSIATVFCQHSL